MASVGAIVPNSSARPASNSCDKGDHLRIKPEPVITVEKIESAALIHRVGNGEKDVRKRVNGLIFGVIISART